MNDLLKLEDVTKYYTSAGGIGMGLHKVNLTFNLGEFVVITGASGSGKTTLLNVITGMDSYEEGAIFVNGEDTTYFGKEEYEEYRRKYISFIFQNYNLIDSFTVYQNVELALIARGIDKKERKEQIIDIIEKVGLKHRINHKVSKLSGGEKQRVSIARALISDAPIIACDEITGNLDMETSLEIIALLKKLSAGKLVLLVSHDVNEAIEHATRVVVMHDGSVDKDYTINHDQKIDETKNSRTMNKIIFSDVIKLSIINLLSTPTKLILLFLISLFFSSFLLVSLMAYNYMDQVALKITNIKTSADGSNYNNRIVVKKLDKSTFSNSEIEEIKKIKNVSSIVKEDIFFDKVVQYAFDDDVDDMNYESPIIPVSVIKNRDLRYGRLPKNANEVVLVGPRKLLHQKVYFIVDGDLELREAKVVGLLPQSSSQTFYIHNDIYESILEKLEMSSVFLGFKEESDDNELMMLSTNYDWYIDDTLGDDELIVTSHTTKADDNELYYSEKPYLSREFVFESNNKQLLFTLQMTYKKYVYDKEEDKFLKGKDKLEFICNESRIGTRRAYLSTANYLKLKEFLQVSNQISILTKNEESVKQVVNELEKMDYYCSAKALIENKDTSMIAQGLKIAVILIELVLIIGIVLIMNVIIRNVLNSQQKSFLVMRSLGIDGNNITLQVYAELFFMLLTNFTMILLMWIIFKNRNFGGFFVTIHKSSNLSLLLIFFISTLVFSFIGYKYSNNVIKSTIVNKEME